MEGIARAKPRQSKREEVSTMDSREPEVASATECTGLAPALPQDGAQEESCARLYGVHPAKRRKRAKGK